MIKFIFLIFFIFIVLIVYIKNILFSDHEVVSIDHSYRESSYNVGGNTALELMQNMSFWDGGHWAHVSWNVDYDLSTIQDGSLCRVKRIVIHSRSFMRMPKIAFYSFPPSCLKQNFLKMRQNLYIHEMGHVNILNDGLIHMKKSFLDIDSFKNCSGLSDRVRAEFNKVMNDISVQQANYDFETEHGVKQGVRLDDCSGQRLE